MDDVLTTKKNRGYAAAFAAMRVEPQFEICDFNFCDVFELQGG